MAGIETYQSKRGGYECVRRVIRISRSGTFFMRKSRNSTAILLTAAALVSGCSSTAPSLPSVAMPDVSAITPKLAPADAPRPVGAPTEIYTRVGRGILTCWFGPGGPLKPNYIYNADADPPSKGGASVISIHQRDREATDPRSIRAWKLAIIPDPEGTKVEIENFKLPPEIAEPLARDARRWAAGEENCGDAPILAAPPPAQTPTPVIASKKPAAKPAAKPGVAPKPQ